MYSSWSKDLSCSDVEPTTLTRFFKAIVTILFAICCFANGEIKVTLLCDLKNPGINLLILIPGRRDVSRSTLFLNVGRGTYFPLGRWRSNGVPVLFGITIPLCFAFVSSETSGRLTSASTSMIFAWLPLPTFFGCLPWLPLPTYFGCIPCVLCVMFFGCTSCTTWCWLEACRQLWMDLKKLPGFRWLCTLCTLCNDKRNKSK